MIMVESKLVLITNELLSINGYYDLILLGGKSRIKYERKRQTKIQ